MPEKREDVPLYDLTTAAEVELGDTPTLTAIKPTSFAAQGVLERSHLQAALRDQIEVIDSDLIVLSEEFLGFEAVNRRIDLLCLDRRCRLIVIELKRTADGGHMELQALRYAAMVSTMTFDQVVETRSQYLVKRGFDLSSEAEVKTGLLEWLGAEADEEPVVSQDVGIVLASEDFSQEITTTVLWLNEFHAFDIRCVRLSPYLLGERLLLDVQPVIPLPEASAYTVRVREKQTSERQGRSTSGMDWTKFVIRSPSGETEPLAKRWAVLRLVQALSNAGVTMDQISEILPDSKTLAVDGHYDDADDLWDAIAKTHDRSEDNKKRWHLADPIATATQTWVVNNNWGLQTREVFKGLLAVAPDGFAVYDEAGASVGPSTRA